jgi:hypothetical protein
VSTPLRSASTHGRGKHVAHRLKVAGTLAALTLLTACNSNDPPPPAQTTPPSTTSTPPRPTTIAAKAPPVTDPLSTTVNFVTDPCRMLTEAQQKQFALDQARVSDIAVEGNSCFFRKNRDIKQAVSVTIAQDEPDGLSSRYQEHASGTWNYWEPTTVDGYPALGFDATDSADLHPELCNFAIGIKDNLYFWATADDAPGTARCSAAKEVASAVLATLKASR